MQCARRSLENLTNHVIWLVSRSDIKWVGERLLRYTLLLKPLRSNIMYKKLINSIEK